MYVAGEIVGAHLSGEAPEPRRVVTVTALGATGDAVCLRAFHAVMDRRVPVAALRVVCEQVAYAPLSTGAYLSVVRGGWSSWDWDEFRTLYLRDMMFWSGTSYAGYRLVPLTHRYLFISAASLVWNTWRSALTRGRNHPDDA